MEIGIIYLKLGSELVPTVLRDLMFRKVAVPPLVSMLSIANTISGVGYLLLLISDLVLPSLEIFT